MNRYLSVFTNKRMLTTLLLGFSGGLPLALTGGTLQAWLADAKVNVATIGMTALIGLPYALKFLWAPLMDAKALPFLGLRRGWLAVTQLGLFCATIGLAYATPNPEAMFAYSAIAILVAFFSASQDIVIDAYRTEVIEDRAELGAGASTYITGYRIAMVVSGGLALILADREFLSTGGGGSIGMAMANFMHFFQTLLPGVPEGNSWTAVYVLMAMINLVGLVTVLLSPEPAITRKLSKGNMRETVVQPFLEFFQRSGAMEILIFIMVYKLSTLMATALTTKFLMDLGYAKAAIGAVTKFQGLIATIAGTLTGGALMAKFGLKRSLWIFGIVQSLVGLTFCLLSRVATPEAETVQLAILGGMSLKTFYLMAIICLDNFMMGMGTAALTGFMMNFCSRQYTATQYALLTSVMAVARVILIAHAGTVVAAIGWDFFFIATVPLAIPGLLLLNRYDHWQTLSTKPINASIPRFDLAMLALFGLSLIALSMEPIWQAMGMKEVGAWCTWSGAVGVAILVAVGLAKPYLGAGGSGKLKTA